MKTPADCQYKSPEFEFMGEAPGFVAVGQAPVVVAVGYARTSPSLGQVTWLADHLLWYQHRQPMYLPSLPGQSSEVH